MRGGQKAPPQKCVRQRIYGLHFLYKESTMKGEKPHTLRLLPLGGAVAVGRPPTFLRGRIEEIFRRATPAILPFIPPFCATA